MYEDDDLSLFENTTWHVPAVLGLTLGGLAAWYAFSQKQGSFAGYSPSTGRCRVKRGPNKGQFKSCR
jgi:hypothetical protein